VVLGVGEGLFLPGSFSIIPTLLPDEDLQAGNALASSGTMLATFIGPALGGVLVALLGSAPAFGLDAVSFVVSALTLAGVRAEKRPLPIPGTAQAAPEPDRLGPEAVSAASEHALPAAASSHQPTLRQVLASERVLQIILLISVAANLCSGGESEVGLPALAHGPFHAGAAGYGALIAAFGAGALIGTLVAGQMRSPRRPAMVGSFAFLAEAGFMAAVPFLGGTVGAAAALIAFGALNGFGNVTTITAFQRWAPPAMLGRLMGLLLLTSFGAFPVSVALAAVAVQHFGPAPLFPFAGAALAAAILFGLTQSRWRDFGTEGPMHSPTGSRA
jgi:predicted MFS family arabinose efflux permease